MMTPNFFSSLIADEVRAFLREDGIEGQLNYFQQLPQDPRHFRLKVKSDLVLCGLAHFKEVFVQLGANPEIFSNLEKLEGKSIKASESRSEFKLELPFALGITGERVALNLLQRASAIATHVSKFVERCAPLGIVVLDTRKTTPGLRNLEKYAFMIGGGRNHRLHQTQAWMIKDNHKEYWGGIGPALDFFAKQGSFYQNMIVEVHSLFEISLAQKSGAKHLLLDNFTTDLLKEAIAIKESGVTFEVSGGINLGNLGDFLLPGIDAISVGSVTQFPLPVDLSLKLEKK